MPSSPLRFEFHGLRCSRGGDVLFDGVGESLESGQLLAVYGANGSGKSSLLRILAGLLKADKGQVVWEGKAIADSGDFSHHRLYMGHGGLIKPELTVMEHCLRWAKLQGEPMLVDAALRYFDLGWARNIPCQRLSAGWQRRVELARLLYQPATLWLLDEPLVHLDGEGEALLASLCNSRLEQGGIVVMASHARISGVPNLKELSIEPYRATKTEEAC